ncbi:MAG: hypothetical protein HY900_18910 [Deltaproteobacteria bacterium]|nr:hypothetical protein [Deltaproteobacteria bacterium]
MRGFLLISVRARNKTMKAYLRLKVLGEQEGELHVAIDACNGQSATVLDFYAYRDDWRQFAERLVEFPKSTSDEARCELGEDDEKWAYYLLLRAFCFDLAGHAALEVAAFANFTPPRGHRERFFIEAEPAALNRLGDTIIDFLSGGTEALEWEPR